MNVGHYENESSRADQAWTAVISPYLHWGELSPRFVLLLIEVTLAKLVNYSTHRIR